MGTMKSNNKKGTIITTVLFIFIGILIGMAGLTIYHHFSETKNPLISSHYNHTFGIDVSHYQGKINWDKVKTSHHPIQFVCIRSTMGIDGKDKQFRRNWKKAKSTNLVCGAYHYYRPNENSSQQFENYKKHVHLKKGDLPPILDIERLGSLGKANIRKGVLNWLKLAEEHYGVKPIVYTGRHFYHHHLKGHIDDYPLWISSFSEKKALNGIDWSFHQFTARVRVTGIKSRVDGNDFNGSIMELQEMCLGE